MLTVPRRASRERTPKRNITGPRDLAKKNWLRSLRDWWKRSTKRHRRARMRTRMVGGPDFDEEEAEDEAEEEEANEEGLHEEH